MALWITNTSDAYTRLLTESGYAADGSDFAGFASPSNAGPAFFAAARAAGQHFITDPAYGAAVGSNAAGTEVADTAALRAAIAAATTYGGTVVLPPPSVAYRIDTTASAITVPPGVHIRGVHGRYHGVRINHLAGPILFDMTGGFEARRISDLIIIGGVAGAKAFQVRAQDTRLSRIMFSEYVGEVCIETDLDPGSGDGPYFCHFSDIQVRCWTGTVGTVNYGVLCKSNFNSSSISKSSFTGCKVAGVQVKHGAGWQIRDVSLEHNATASSLEYGIIVGGHATLIPQGGTIDGIEAESNGKATIHVTHAHGLTLNNVYAYGPGYYATADYGLLIEDASGTSTNVRDVTITGGFFISHDVADIRIVGTTRVVLINVNREDTVSLGTGGDYNEIGEAGARFTQKVSVAAGKRIYTDGGTSAGMQSPDQNSIEFYRGGGGTPVATINGNGVQTLGWYKHVPVANASLPAAGAAQDGTIIIDSTNNRLVYYSGGARRYIGTGTSF